MFPSRRRKLIASLDLASTADSSSGIGTGWNAEEMATHGGDPAKRGAVATEHILAMKEIWHHENAEFHRDSSTSIPSIHGPNPFSAHIRRSTWAEQARRHSPGRPGGRRLVPQSRVTGRLGPKIARLRRLAGREVRVTVLHVGPAEPNRRGIRTDRRGAARLPGGHRRVGPVGVTGPAGRNLGTLPNSASTDLSLKGKPE